MPVTTVKSPEKVSDLIGGKGRQVVVCRIDRSSYTKRKTTKTARIIVRSRKK